MPSWQRLPRARQHQHPRPPPRRPNPDGEATGDACNADDDNDGVGAGSDSSALNPRTCRDAAPGLVRCNAHADPIAWREGRCFVGAERALDAVLEHLVQRRRGTADRDEPTGLLTHHLVFDAEAWRFVGELLARTRRHPAARWVGVVEAMHS